MNNNNFVPEGLSELSPQELLQYYDNPRNFSIPDHIAEAEQLQPHTFPENITLLLTHGLFSLGRDDRKAVVKQIENTEQAAHDLLMGRKKAYRLIKNFSDFGTRKVIKNMFTLSGDDWYYQEDDLNEQGNYQYPENVIVPYSPRIKGDPARAINADDFIRKTDFNGNELLPTGYLGEDSSGEKNHQTYHSEIESRLSSVEKDTGGSITFDIHDTGVNMMGKTPEGDIFREGGYPMMEIGTLDGDSCNPEILEYFSAQVEKYFGFTPIINQRYKGGYVTQRHGRTHREELLQNGKNSKKRNVIQIELGRYLYMKESTQEIDHEQAKKVGAALRMCIQKTGDKFGEQYFDSGD